MFEIDGELISFNDTVVPAVPDMISAQEDYSQRFQSVADGAMAFNGSLTGSYESNSSGQFIIAGEIENSSCLSEVAALDGQLAPILADCTALGEMIAKLLKLKADGEKKLAQKNANTQTINGIKATASNREDGLTTAEQQKINDLEAENAQLQIEIDKIKEEFDALHEEAKAKLASLKGSDVSLPDIPVMSGTLSFEPSISAASAQGNAGYKSEFYNYQVGDQSISSVSN